MKKFYLLFLALMCLCSMNVFADCNCPEHNVYQTGQNCAAPCPKQVPACQKPCDKPKKKLCPEECFLCTNKSMESLFSCAGLSDTQICTAMKIQDKYALEVLSLNEKIQCEQEKYEYLTSNCASKSELRKQKKIVKELKKERKKICKCYEEQFMELLSKDQLKAYKKAKKN